MKNSNFIQVLATLDKKELKDFEKYLKGNYSKQSVMLDIFFYCKKYYPEFEESQKLRLPYVSKKLFNTSLEKNPKMSRLRNGLSDLNIKLKEFLIWQKIKSNTLENEFHWLEILEEKGLKKKWENQLEKQLTELDQISGFSPRNVFRRLQLHHFAFFRNDMEKNDPKIYHVQKELQYLDEFFLYLKFRLACELKNREDILPSSPAHFYLPLPTSFVKTHEEKLNIEIRWYANFYEFLSTPNENNYHIFKELLLSNTSSIRDEEKLTGLIYLVNYLTKGIKEGNDDLHKEVFSLYDFGIQSKFIFYKNLIDSLVFQNIVHVACFLKKFEWAIAFIEKHQIFLAEEIRKDHKIMALATVYFKKEGFQKVLGLLKPIQFKDIMLTLKAKLLVLASQYEIGLFDDLYEKGETFIRFVKRNKKIGEDNTAAGKNFAEFFKKLLRRNQPYIQLEEELKTLKPLFLRQWLEQKLKTYKQI